VVTSARRTRFRYHAALAVAGVIALIGAIPAASAAPYLLPLLLVPLAVTGWAWLAGTDAGPDGLVVRALLGRRRIPWPAVSELGADARGRAYATLVDGRAVPLPAVTAADLPRLVAASGHRLPEAAPAGADETTTSAG
jgi:Bacterial PH domain